MVVSVGDGARLLVVFGVFRAIQRTGLDGTGPLFGSSCIDVSAGEALDMTVLGVVMSATGDRAMDRTGDRAMDRTPVEYVG